MEWKINLYRERFFCWRRLSTEENRSHQLEENLYRLSWDARPGKISVIDEENY